MILIVHGVNSHVCHDWSRLFQICTRDRYAVKSFETEDSVCSIGNHNKYDRKFGQNVLTHSLAHTLKLFFQNTHCIPKPVASSFWKIILNICSFIAKFSNLLIIRSFKNQNISIFHRCEVWTQISVSRDTVWYHSAEPRDAKPWPERRKFLSVPNNYDRYSFFHTMHLFISCHKMHTVCRFCHYSSQLDRYAQFALAYCCKWR